MKAYAGIGSRQTPSEILGLMTLLARHLGRQGWTLRSGHADGADWAFESGAPHRLSEIYLPWSSFNENFRGGPTPRRTQPQDEAYEIAAEFHPAWERLSRGARALHARNVHQMLGPDVTDPRPSKFVVAWTPGGGGGGGTGQAIRIANAYDVPTFDLARAEDLARVKASVSFYRE